MSSRSGGISIPSSSKTSTPSSSSARSPARSSARIHLSRPSLDRWSVSMRMYLAQRVLRPFLAKVLEGYTAMSRLAQLVLEQPNVATMVRQEEMELLKELITQVQAAQQRQSFSGSLALVPNARSEEAIMLLRSRFGQRPEVQSWNKNVEPYFALDMASSTASFAGSPASSPMSPTTPASPVVSGASLIALRVYILQRIQSLVGTPGDDTLSKFQLLPQSSLGTETGSIGMMNRGGWAGLNSFGLGYGSPSAAQASSTATSGQPSSSFPSDPTLLFHLFCVHMESVSPNFINQYIRDVAHPTPGLAETLSGGLTSSGATAAGLSTYRTMLMGGGSALDSTSCLLVQVRPAQATPYFVVVQPAPASGAGMRGMGGLASTAVATPSTGGRGQAGVSGGSGYILRFLTEPGRHSLFQAMSIWARTLAQASTIHREFIGVIDEDESEERQTGYGSNKWGMGGLSHRTRTGTSSSSSSWATPSTTRHMPILFILAIVIVTVSTSVSTCFIAAE